MRRKILRISIPMFLNMFNGKPVGPFKATEETKIPKDTIVIDVKWNGFDDCIDMLIESKIFDKVEKGAGWPIHYLTAERI